MCSLCEQLPISSLGQHRWAAENTHNGFLYFPLLQEWEAKDALMLLWNEVECVTFGETVEVVTMGILPVLEEALVCCHSHDYLKVMCRPQHC